VRKQTQISARISSETKDELDSLVSARGLKKEFVIETALQHHLQALRELPADVIVPPVIVLTPRSAEDVLYRIRSAQAPTQALKDLMAADGD
jgi:uncharacterized protein (DUF1778 family)